MPTKGLAPGQRRRDRDARATLRRIEHQRAALSTRYGQANTPVSRFAVVAAALRTAAAPGAHQVDRDTVARLVATVTDAARAAVDELHRRQHRRAEQILTTETERRKHREHQSRRPRRNTAG